MTERDPLPGDTPETRESGERITVPTEKILGHLRTLGDVTVLRDSPDAQRLIVCVKQDHGSVAEHREWIRKNAVGKVQGWIRHQNEITRIGMETDKLHPGKVRFFMENYTDGQAFRSTSPEEREKQEDVFRRAGSNSTIALNMAQAVTQSPPGLDAQYLLSQMGMTRIMLNLAAKDPSAVSRIHGLQYPTRGQYVQMRTQLRILGGNFAELQAAAAEDYRRMNAHAIAQVNRYATPGDCAMIILGGSHFQIGTDIQELLAYGDTPRNIEELMLDTVMLQHPSLGDSTIAVLKPKNYPKND